MDPEITLDRSDGIRIFGVVYSRAFFKAMAARLGPGTHVDVLVRSDGSALLYHHQPRQPPGAPA